MGIEMTIILIKNVTVQGAAALKHSAQSSNIFTTFPTKDYVPIKGF